MDGTRIRLILLLAAVLLGCGKQPEPRHIVILVDVSGSIDRQTLDQAFKAIDEMISRLHRGDSIAIIPILGDADAEASGRIIRFQVPTQRQAYDADIRAFRSRLAASLKSMESEALAVPGSKTDILGSVALAEQEFRAGSDGPKQLLIIMSDFIQEDAETNFRIDERLRTPADSTKVTQEVAKGNAFNFRSTTIYLGVLRSDEYAHLGKSRRAAIKTFWLNYFTSLGGKPEFISDGPGLLERFAMAK